MSSKQKHRGLNPQDSLLFASENWAVIRASILDLFYLRSRNYGENASLKIVGDRYQLKKRQRYALNRIVSAKGDVEQLQLGLVTSEEIKNASLFVDGFNVIILAEVLFSQGLVFECVDGTFRDIASIHGSYHPVEETTAAILAIGQSLMHLLPSEVTWYLDAPVSNSGKLRSLIMDIAHARAWNWKVILANNPDLELIGHKDEIIVSSDRVILSRCSKWFNFSRYFVVSNRDHHQSVITLTDLGLHLEDFNLS